MCAGHREGEKFIADVIRGRHGDPHAAAREFAQLAKQYRCRAITGDAYSREWCAGFYRAECGLEYRQSGLPRSDLYLEGQPAFLRGCVSIPLLPVLSRELRLLERRTSRAGKDSVSKGPGSFDDHANSLFGCMYVAAKAALVRDEKIVMPFIHSVPRHVPGSAFAGDRSAPVSPDSPHRPSSSEPWYRFVRGDW